MERIRVKIVSSNRAGGTVEQEGEIVHFLPNGNAIVVLTSKLDKGRFKAVNLHEITVIDNSENGD